MFKNALHSKSVEVGLHLLFWVFYFAYPMLKFSEQHWFEFHAETAIVDTLFLGSSVYLTLFLAYKGLTKPFYLLVTLVVILILIYFNCTLNGQNCDCNFRLCFINKVVEYFFVIIFFTALLTFKKNLSNKQTLERIQQEKVQAELKSLKAQMNPHFLFNTLNMLYSNALAKDEALADKILKLSDSLHYLIHEGERQEVSIEKELGFIKGYIALQKARLGEKIKIDFRHKIDEIKRPIPPLLIIPFVENAFKYASMTEGNQIPIKIDITLKDDQLQAIIENSFDPGYDEKNENGWKQSGIGIKNTKRRLALMYPSKHELNLDSSNDVFKVELKINLR